MTCTQTGTRVATTISQLLRFCLQKHTQNWTSRSQSHL